MVLKKSASIVRNSLQPKGDLQGRANTQARATMQSSGFQFGERLSPGLYEHVLVELEKLMPKSYLAQLAARDSISARKELERALFAITSKPPCKMDDYQKRMNFIKSLTSILLGFGPIDELLEDPDVTEVMVNGVGKIFYERQGRIYRHADSFESEEQIRAVIDRIISPLGRRLDERTPIVNARLKEGHRVHAIIPPLAIDGTHLTIRKFREETHSLSELVEMGSLPRKGGELLSWLVQLRKNIAVTGGTGSGKTTLLNALSNEVDARERIITIEDSAELKFDRHPHVVRLESRSASIEGSGEVSIRDLVIASLRMRPDRIVVGEVRGAEAIEMLQAMNTGHDGSMTTLHANSPSEAISRLITLVGYSSQISEKQVRSQIASAIDIIAHQERFSDGSRKVSQICMLRKKGIDGVEILPILNFKQCSTVREVVEGEWEIHLPQAIAHELIVKGIASKEEVLAWISQDLQ